MKSIIFNQHQVNHALNNKEGMFRVVCKKTKNEGGLLLSEAPYQIGQEIFVKEKFSRFYVCKKAPYYKLRLSIRSLLESFDKNNNILYWTDRNTRSECFGKPKSPVHMKQEHSRLTLRIKRVKVERLQNISEEDCWKEGVWNIQEKGSPRSWDIKNAFAKSWNSTHKKPEEKFEANPFVFCFSYEVVR